MLCFEGELRNRSTGSAGLKANLFLSVTGEPQTGSASMSQLLGRAEAYRRAHTQADALKHKAS